MRIDKKSRIIAAFVVSVIGLILTAIFKPAITFASSSTWWFVLSMIVIAIIVFKLAEFYSDEEFIFTIIFVVIGVVFLIIFAIGGINSGEVFNTKKYHNLVKIENGIFEEDIAKYSENYKYPVIEIAVSENLRKTEETAYSKSRLYETSKEYSIIKYKERYYKLYESLYKNFSAYNEMKEKGISGYEIYDLETGETTFIGLEDYIKYSPSAYFKHNIKWHLYINFSNMILGESVFEIDESGVPYYITPTFKATIGWFGGRIQDKVIVTNAMTGENTVYKVSEVPEWIDNVYGKDYLLKMIKHNLLNAENDSKSYNITVYDYNQKKKIDSTSYGISLTSDGDIALCTEVFSIDTKYSINNKSTIGFIFANLHTGVIKYYNRASLGYEKAIESVRKLMPVQSYKISYPSVVNINSEETYCMAFSENGLIKSFALCNMADVTKAVSAQTIKEAVKKYKEILNISDTSIKVEYDENDNKKEDDVFDSSKLFEAEGTIESIYTAEVEGFTHFYFVITGSKNFYDSIITNNSKQVLLEAGTKVKIKYENSSEEGVYIVKEIDF